MLRSSTSWDSAILCLSSPKPQMFYLDHFAAVNLAVTTISGCSLVSLVSRRSARVSRLPHSHEKVVLPEHHTAKGPSRTVRSPHSSHTSTMFLRVAVVPTRPPPRFARFVGRQQPTSHTGGGGTTSILLDSLQVLVHPFYHEAKGEVYALIERRGIYWGRCSW